jgi:hypothetical protein
MPNAGLGFTEFVRAQAFTQHRCQDGRAIILASLSVEYRVYIRRKCGDAKVDWQLLLQAQQYREGCFWFL